MRVCLKTLGCRLNEAELQRWASDFSARGCTLTSEASDADLVVINTCAVTHNAVRESRRLIRRAQRNNPLAKLVVSGCYASLDTASASDAGAVDLIVPNHDKDQLVERTIQALELPVRPAEAMMPDGEHLFTRGRHRAFVKVQDGCRHRCTYCIVTIARGEEQSRAIGAIVDEINGLTAGGVQEAVLTGVHLGGYGNDTGGDLYQLVDAIMRDTDLPRLRLSSLEPWNIPDQFHELFANPRLMPHVHLPLQSGSDGVLKRMARRSKTAAFEKLATMLRDAIPDLNITTDIIVGFPGETEREWRESLAFIERIELSHIHIFSYSARAGTKAARLPGQIAPSVKKTRSLVLHRLAAAMKARYLKRHLHRTFPILWENGTSTEQGAIRHHGYTPNFLRAQIDLIPDEQREPLTNTIRNARAVAVDPGGAILHCVPA